ncbi:MAG TPA: putative zinc-binding protein [Povalibacter sp.]|nr:putative zinc-binding protein [Povalibacter sp.]
MSKHSAYRNLPLVYSCSGCSSAAQLANHIALRLDREQVAEMSCIAGVGGGVESLVNTARSGRPIIALDGCQLHCARRCLEQQGVTPTLHYTLSDFGVRKRYHAEFSGTEAEPVLAKIHADLNEETDAAEPVAVVG